MYQITISPIIQQISIGFHIFGMWQNEEEMILRKMGKFFNLILPLSFIIALVTGAYFTADNKNESIFLVAVTISIIVAFVRLTFVLTKKNEISELLQNIGVCYYSVQQEYIQTKMKLTNFTRIAYSLILIQASGILYPPILCLPTFSSEKLLPFNIGFPLNWRTNEIVYWIAFIYIECRVTFGDVATLVVLPTWYLMTNYSIKYQMLGNKLNNLGLSKTAIKTFSKTMISQAATHNLFAQDLIKLIKIHRQTQKMIERFRDCFSNLFFTQITTSAICICGGVYVLAFSSCESLFETIFFGFFITHSVLDILTLMYFGNEIKLSSGHLSYCLFESNWINESESCKKITMILTEVLKQLQELAILKLYPLDLEKFTSILKLAYSMFNILQSLN